MRRAHFWERWIARLTCGAVPVDGSMHPPVDPTCETTPPAKPVPRPREPLATETEFDVAIYPRWGNFR